MSLDVTVKADDVHNLVKALRQHADGKELRRELYRGLNSVSKKVRGQMVEVIPAALPRRGGLAAEVQRGIRARTVAKSGKYAGISIKYRHRNRDVRTLVGKRLRHPVYGNRDRWVTQTRGVDPAVFVGEFEQQRPEIQRAMVDVLETIARKVIGAI